MSPCSRCVCVCVACTCVPGAAVRVSQAPESEWVILSVRARAMQGSSKNQETEGGPGPREKLEGSMKEGCVREFVKGGVCERQGQRETLAPSVREDPLYPVCWPGWLPKTQPRVPPLLEPPDTLSPSPLFGGWVGGNPAATEEKRSKRKAGVSWSGYGLVHHFTAS